MVRTCTALLLLLPSLIAVRGEVPDFPMTFAEMQVQAGYYTEDGKYLGGLPKADDLSREIYDCQHYQNASASTNSTVCMEWRADESVGGTFEVGSCECKFVAGERYCSAWTCNQVTTSTHADANVDAVLCSCDIESSSRQFCDAWSCKQIDSAGRVEFEAYNCLRASASGDYCDAWNGHVTAQDEVEVVACQCVAEWQGDGVCSYWECEELALKTCASSPWSWCNMGVSVGVGGGLGFLGVVALCFGVFACKDGSFTTLSLTSFFVGMVWCLLWAIPVVIWGGEDGARYVGVMWGLPIALTMASAVEWRSCPTELISSKGKGQRQLVVSPKVSSLSRGGTKYSVPTEAESSAADFTNLSEGGCLLTIS